MRTDIPNDPVDDHIHYTLETDTVIASRRKQALWERIEKEAAQQVILVPYAIPPRPLAPPLNPLERVVQSVSLWLAVLFFDDALYHRAAATRRMGFSPQMLIGLDGGGSGLSFSSLNLLHLGLH